MKTPRHTFRYILGIALISTCLLVYHLVQYDTLRISEDLKGVYSKPSSPQQTTLLFPAHFENAQDYVAAHPDLQGQTISQHEASQPEPTVKMSSKTKPHTMEVFSGFKNINLDLKKCDALRQEHTVSVDYPVSFKIDMNKILQNVLEEVDNNPQSYVGEISPLFIDELRIQLKHKVTQAFWYRLAGSSVWLKEYGVHFSISRVIYSPDAVRNQPVFSLVYAQIFDRNWKELTDTNLVVPSNGEGDDAYAVIKFPYFVPIPYYHDVDSPQQKYFGPEDAHVSLTKNKNGYEEPLLIFNAFNRKYIHNPHYDDKTGKAGRQQTIFTRSMFVSWPFQFQNGKLNTDGAPSPEYDDRKYTRAVELEIENIPRQKKQKNWVPMINHAERKEHGYDKSLYIVYRWSNLEVLKCDFESGKCHYDYQLIDGLDVSAKVGPLRGGTQMINLNDLIESQTDIPLDQIIPKGREIWVGFPRAHLDNCGCGSRMYRPNFVAIVKDTVAVKENGKIVTKNLYKNTHVSSSVSFDVPLLGWAMFNPKALCQESNVLIPNGISSWSINDLSQDTESGTWKVKDQLTIMLSISDLTVHRVTVEGLLEQVLNFNSPSLFLSSTKGQETQKQKDVLGVPNPDQVRGSTYFANAGYNDNSVSCAMQGSKQFCAAYGKDFADTWKQNPKQYNEFVKDNAIEIDDAAFDKYISDWKTKELVDGKNSDVGKHVKDNI